ncbi:MAG: bifunctional DNA primase/polymerase [Aggregatilineales bacterium]
MPHVPSFHTQSATAKRRLAERYARRLSMAAFPVIGKAPASDDSWRDFIQTPGVHGRAWQSATGYALAPVLGSCLAIIDVDDAEFMAAMRSAVPRLAQTFQVTRGPHVHFYVNLAVPLVQSVLKLRHGASEIASIRGVGAYVVGPYSDHLAACRRENFSSRSTPFLTQNLIVSVINWS